MSKFADKDLEARRREQEKYEREADAANARTRGTRPDQWFDHRDDPDIRTAERLGRTHARAVDEGREESAAELRAEFEALLASAPEERRDWLEVAGRHAERSERFLLNPPQTVTRLGRIKGSVAFWWNALGDPKDNSLRKLVAVVSALGVWLVAREYETPMQSLGRGFRHELYVAFHGGVWVPFAWGLALVLAATAAFHLLERKWARGWKLLVALVLAMTLLPSPAPPSSEPFDPAVDCTVDLVTGEERC